MSDNLILKNNLKIYITHYPDGFVGAIKAIGNILADLSIEWSEYNKNQWAETLSQSSKKLIEVAQDLHIIKEQHDAEFFHNIPIITES